MGEVEEEEGEDQIKALATIEQSEWTFRHSYPSAQRKEVDFDTWGTHSLKH